MYSDISIIGGGFSGLLVLHHLVSNPAFKGCCTIFEPRPKIGCGLAYSTNTNRHRLNVRAGSMSAFPAEPLHFLSWLNSPTRTTTPNEDRCIGDYRATDFVGRALYGHYLTSIAEDAHRIAERRDITITHCRDSVTDIRRLPDGYELVTEHSGSWSAEKVAFCIGNSGFTGELVEGAIKDIWNFDYRTLQARERPVAHRFGAYGSGYRTFTA
jgi:uncharacterized NAD(P)/FAD-binding protein YdhS